MIGRAIVAKAKGVDEGLVQTSTVLQICKHQANDNQLPVFRISRMQPLYAPELLYGMIKVQLQNNKVPVVRLDRFLCLVLIG